VEFLKRLGGWIHPFPPPG